MFDIPIALLLGFVVGCISDGIIRREDVRPYRASVGRARQNGQVAERRVRLMDALSIAMLAWLAATIYLGVSSAWQPRGQAREAVSTWDEYLSAIVWWFAGRSEEPTMNATTDHHGKTSQARVCALAGIIIAGALALRAMVGAGPHRSSTCSPLFILAPVGLSLWQKLGASQEESACGRMNRRGHEARAGRRRGGAAAGRLRAQERNGALRYDGGDHG